MTKNRVLWFISNVRVVANYTRVVSHPVLSMAPGRTTELIRLHPTKGITVKLLVGVDLEAYKMDTDD